MKKEKICFSKRMGIIAVVGVVFIGAAVLMNALTSNQTSTNTKAAGCYKGESKCTEGTLVGQCSKSSTQTSTEGEPANNGYKCVCTIGKVLPELVPNLLDCPKSSSHEVATCRGTCSGVRIGECKPNTNRYCQCSPGSTTPTLVADETKCPLLITNPASNPNF